MSKMYQKRSKMGPTQHDGGETFMDMGMNTTPPMMQICEMVAEVMRMKMKQWVQVKMTKSSDYENRHRHRQQPNAREEDSSKHPTILSKTMIIHSDGGLAGFQSSNKELGGIQLRRKSFRNMDGGSIMHPRCSWSGCFGTLVNCQRKIWTTAWMTSATAIVTGFAHHTFRRHDHHHPLPMASRCQRLRWLGYHLNCIHRSHFFAERARSKAMRTKLKAMLMMMTNMTAL
mmetsp:Transcript_24741/g.69470  ORF Transcript_24741/g.69470 Transcript_24741/m.69470 type:complete len:229 (-) Transcript_24741:4385-5071(-)